MAREKKQPGWVDRGKREETKQERKFREARDGQQRRIAENNPNAPSQKPGDWTDEDEAAAEKRRKDQEDNPRGGRYRHR